MTYVELCEEDGTEAGDENKAATHDWQSEVTDLRIKQGSASPCVFWHR